MKKKIIKNSLGDFFRVEIYCCLKYTEKNNNQKMYNLILQLHKKKN